MKRHSIRNPFESTESLAPILRLPEVLKTTGLGRSTVYRELRRTEAVRLTPPT